MDHPDQDYRFNPPPNWPQVPQGYRPQRGWNPPEAWEPAPEGWQFWVPADERAATPVAVKQDVVPSPSGAATTAAIAAFVATASAPASVSLRPVPRTRREARRLREQRARQQKIATGAGVLSCAVLGAAGAVAITRDHQDDVYTAVPESASSLSDGGDAVPSADRFPSAASSGIQSVAASTPAAAPPPAAVEDTDTVYRPTTAARFSFTAPAAAPGVGIASAGVKKAQAPAAVTGRTAAPAPASTAPVAPTTTAPVVTPPTSAPTATAPSTTDPSTGDPSTAPPATTDPTTPAPTTSTPDDTGTPAAPEEPSDTGEATEPSTPEPTGSSTPPASTTPAPTRTTAPGATTSTP